MKVHHFIDFDSKEWNVDIILEVIHPEDIPKILEIKISKTGRRDNYCWKHTSQVITQFDQDTIPQWNNRKNYDLIQ